MNNVINDPVDYLCEIVRADWPLGKDECHTWASRVIEKEPNFAQFIHDLVTDSDIIREKVALSRLTSACSIAIASINKEDYYQRFKYSYPPYLGQMIMAEWVTSDLRKEVPELLAEYGSNFPYIMSHLHERLHDGTDDMVHRHDPSYWRGIAVICFSKLIEAGNWTSKVGEAVLKYALLPTGHPDVTREVSLVKERGSYDAELISGLLAQGKSLSPAIRSGDL